MYSVVIPRAKEAKIFMRINTRKLVVAMFDCGLNQKQLAELSKISRATINGIKNGRSCSDETGYKIAKALNMPIEKLLEK